MDSVGGLGSGVENGFCNEGGGEGVEIMSWGEVVFVLGGDEE